MNRSTWPALVVLVLLAACTQAETDSSSSVAPSATDAAEPSSESSASASGEPTSSGPETATLDVNWTVPFSMAAPADWERDEQPMGTSYALSTGPDRWIVFSDTGPDTVDAWIEELTTTPQLVVTEPEPAEVGGAQGFVFDVSTSSEAPKAAGGSPCAKPCWELIEGWIVEKDRPNRVWLVDVDGKAIMIVTDAPERALEGWAATVEEALATLEWGD